MHIDESSEFVANPSLKIDYVHLKVSDLQTSIDFYQSILGFTVLEDKSNGDDVCMGPQQSNDGGVFHPILVLNQIEKSKNKSSIDRVRREAGLYHFAILLPERKYLASFLNHIRSNLDPQFYEGMADHAVSESIYLHDPDNNGIEVYRDRNPTDWKWVGENKVHMVTEPLDVNNLLRKDGHEKWNGMPAMTTIGHVHLHVSNLAKSKKFYHQSLGLYHTASYPGANFFAANGYHHHVATNTWIGTNILRNSANDLTTAGLHHYAIRITGDKEDINELRNHLIKNHVVLTEASVVSGEQNPPSFYVYDPDGIQIRILFDK